VYDLSGEGSSVYVTYSGAVLDGALLQSGGWFRVFPALTGGTEYPGIAVGQEAYGQYTHSAGFCKLDLVGLHIGCGTKAFGNPEREHYSFSNA
jgi:hypothetical protein